jgi:hypothetical protein
MKADAQPAFGMPSNIGEGVTKVGLDQWGLQWQIDPLAAALPMEIARVDAYMQHRNVTQH